MAGNQWAVRTFVQANGMNGSNVKTWEEQCEARLRDAEEQLARAQAQVEELTPYIEALKTVLDRDKRRRSIPVNGSGSVDPEHLKALPIRGALIEIAKLEHGLLAVTEAMTILVQAGVFQNRRHARKDLYSTLNRSKDFQKERPGIYSLKGYSTTN